MNDLGDMFGGGVETEGGGFADLFRNLGRGRGTRRAAPATRGNDIKHELTIPFNTAVLGGEAALTVQRQDGDLETIKVKIPAGIADGKKIRLRGQGVPGTGDAPAGDILLTIHVSPHPSFRRTENRLDVRVPITLAEAALGAKIDVPTPHGEGGRAGVITLTVPPNTSSGKRLRIKGHGVRPANEPPGDLFAEIEVVFPPNLSEPERQQLAEISNRHPQNPRSELRW
jgi:DnaJ-class molecular chaperone